MSRIRTVKPELFRHEDLFDAELETGLPLRLAFIGLFTVADCAGRFRLKPRTLKLDVLPHDNVDFSAVLAALERYGFIQSYTVNGERFAWIPSFQRHQRLQSKEIEAGSDLPDYESRDADRPTNEAQPTTQTERTHPERNWNASGSVPVRTENATGTQPEAQEGKGREGNRKGRGRAFIAPARNTPTAKTAFPLDLDLTASIRPWADERGYADLDRHLDHFRDKSLANGYRYADWSAAFKTAVRDDWARLRTPTPIPQARKPFAPPNRATAVDSTDPNIAEVQSILAGTYRPVIEGECHATH